jgi:hypothetical protein
MGADARGSVGNARPINGDLTQIWVRAACRKLQPDGNNAPVDGDLATHWSYAMLFPLLSKSETTACSIELFSTR